jgi:predicted AlkP superfamily pyrophosphatase or phosphodiesterase
MTDAQIVDTVCADLDAGTYDFHFVYLSELDNYLHTNIHDEQKVEDAMRKYERFIGRIHEHAKRAGEAVNFYVASDHGMTAKRGGFDLIGKIRPLGFKVGKDYIELYDSTMARFWFFNDEARKQINALLSSLDAGRLLSERELTEFGVYFPDKRFGESIFLMNPGVLIEPSFMGTKAPNGMHGFHPDDIHSSASFLAEHKPEIPIRTLADLRELMRRAAFSPQGARKETSTTVGTAVHA